MILLRTLIGIATLSAVFVLSACATSSVATTLEPWLAADSEYTRICDLRQAGEAFVGRTVRLRGTYMTDTTHYGVLGDPMCPPGPGQGIEPVDCFYSSGDASVAAFCREKKGYCGGSTTCPLSFHLDVDALIIKNPEGGAVMASLKHVHFSKRL
jgi:hypothetical protein